MDSVVLFVVMGKVWGIVVCLVEGAVETAFSVTDVIIIWCSAFKSLLV